MKPYRTGQVIRFSSSIIFINYNYYIVIEYNYFQSFKKIKKLNIKGIKIK